MSKYVWIKFCWQKKRLLRQTATTTMVLPIRQRMYSNWIVWLSSYWNESRPEMMWFLPKPLPRKETALMFGRPRRSAIASGLIKLPAVKSIEISNGAWISARKWMAWRLIVRRMMMNYIGYVEILHRIRWMLISYFLSFCISLQMSQTTTMTTMNTSRRPARQRIHFSKAAKPNAIITTTSSGESMSF